MTLDDYKRELKGAGPKLKDAVLEAAAHNINIRLKDFMTLADLAYPDPVGQ